jgi:hypothetical protein
MADDRSEQCSSCSPTEGAQALGPLVGRQVGDAARENDEAGGEKLLHLIIDLCRTPSRAASAFV